VKSIHTMLLPLVVNMQEYKQLRRLAMSETALLEPILTSFLLFLVAHVEPEAIGRIMI